MFYDYNQRTDWIYVVLHAYVEPVHGGNGLTQPNRRQFDAVVPEDNVPRTSTLLNGPNREQIGKLERDPTILSALNSSLSAWGQTIKHARRTKTPVR